MSKFERIIGKSGMLTIIAFLAVLSFSSCSKDDDGNVQIDNNAILGTWKMIGEEYHPAIATFKSNGEYVWEWGGITGLKDIGTYTLKNGVITMTIKERFHRDYRWTAGELEYGEWQKDTESHPEDPTTRVCTIYTVQESYLVWNFGGDYFYLPDSEYGYSDATTVVFMLNDKYQEPDIDIPLNLFEGEWIARNSEGEVMNRIVVKGNNITSYTAGGINIRQENGEYLYVLTSYKTTGTISFERGFFKVKGKTSQKSFDYKGYDRVTGAEIYEYSVVDPNTLEAAEWITTEDIDYVFNSLVYIADNCMYIQEEGQMTATVFKKK